jgi:hypothetical protein
MVQIQMASPGGTITTRTVPLVSYVDPTTGQTYITLHTDAIQVRTVCINAFVRHTDRLWLDDRAHWLFKYWCSTVIINDIYTLLMSML